MSINRQQRRQAQRQGQVAGDGPDDGAPEDELSATDLTKASLSDPAGVEERETEDLNAARPRPTGPVVHHRFAPRQFLHEVNVEMRKVAWPSRTETANYSLVVFVTLATLMALIFAFDLAFTHLAGFLFNP